MINSPFLPRYKALTQEARIIADEITRRLKPSSPKSLLDVGVGTGEVIEHIKRVFPSMYVAGIEPYLAEVSPGPFYDTIIEAKVEDVTLDRSYDVTIVTHVLGHVPNLNRIRPMVLEKLLQHTTDQLFIVTNAVTDDFKVLQEAVWSAINDSVHYVDLHELLSALPAPWAYHITGLTARLEVRSIEWMVDYLTIFSPRPFTWKEQDVVEQVVRDWSHARHSLVLPIPQFLITIDKDSPSEIPPALLHSHEELWKAISHSR